MTNANATILLVDDDPAILLTLGDKLQFLGYTVITAISAGKAQRDLGALFAARRRTGQRHLATMNWNHCAIPTELRSSSATSMQ